MPMTSAGFDHRTAPLAQLLLRLGLGALFILHLYWKFFILPGGFDRWWGNFARNGYPWYVPWYAFSAEILGALLLIPGIWARWVALYAVPLMAGAADFWLRRKGFYFTAGGAEMPVVWGLMLVLLALFGDGPYALAPSPLPGGSLWQQDARTSQVPASPSLSSPPSTGSEANRP